MSRLRARQLIGWLWLALLFIPIAVSACLPRTRVNTSCDWGDERARQLDLQNAAHLRHLSADAHLAEELAIRYSDLYPSPDLRSRPGYRPPTSADDVLQERAECKAKLSNTIANIHGVTIDQVRQGMGRRDMRVDIVAVVLPMALLLGLTASFVSGRLSRHLMDQRLLTVIMTLFASMTVSAVLVLVGGMWSVMVEVIRVGNGHLSHRASLLPWGEHLGELFVGGILLFLLIARLRYRVIAHDAELSDAHVHSANGIFLR